MTRQSEYGLTEFDNIRFNEDVKVVSYDHSQLAADNTLTIPVPAGTLVMGVGHLVTEAFAGGVPSLDIGDGADADAWLATADISETTLNSFSCSKGGTGAKARGFYFATAGVIKLTHAAGLTDGAGKVFIFQFVPEGNWRVPTP